MINDTLNDLRTANGKAHDALKRELSRLRTGRASADLLDSLRVDYYGTPTPISQMANIAAPEARLLTIKPWDRASIKLIEQAIVTSPLGLNPQNDGELIRLPIPALTEERRKEFAKLARGHGEDAKVAIRKARNECKELLQAIEKDGEASQDDVQRAMKAMEEIVKEGTTTVDEIVGSKEKDIMTV